VSLPRVAAGLAAGVAVLFLIGQGQNDPASSPEAPAPGGELVQDVGDRSPAPSLSDALAGGGELPSETTEAPGGLRPVGFTSETLFDQAREDLLLEVRRGATMQAGTGPFLASPSTSPAPEGELASGFRLQ
jgi:hypothetical protein